MYGSWLGKVIGLPFVLSRKTDGWSLNPGLSVRHDLLNEDLITKLGRNINLLSGLTDESYQEIPVRIQDWDIFFDKNISSTQAKLLEAGCWLI